MSDPSAPSPELLRSIGLFLMDRGMKATRMDDVAKALGMSKRTLYEIFDSKKDMIRQVLKFQSDNIIKMVEEAFENSPNVLVALLKIARHQRASISQINADFFRDMDDLYAEMRIDYEDIRRRRFDGLTKIIKKGIAEGVFRDDADYRLKIRLWEVQMESLKRMEEFFPADITLVEAFEAITDNFLRSIVSPKGLDMLNEMNNQRNNEI